MNDDFSMFHRARTGTLARVAKYTLVKMALLVVTVAVGLYLAIQVANLGGYIDKIYQGMISGSMLGIARRNEFKDMSIEQREQALVQIQRELDDSYGPHKPFILPFAP